MPYDKNNEQILTNIINRWNDSIADTPYNPAATKLNVARWDKTAKTYDNSMGVDEKRFNGYLSALKNHNMLNADCVAMDIGCGTGGFTIMLSEFIKKVYAVDESVNMLEIMKGKLTQDTNVVLMNKSFNDMENINVDLIISNYNPSTYSPKGFEKLFSFGKTGLFSVNSGLSKNEKRNNLKAIIFPDKDFTKSGMDVSFPYDYLVAQGVETSLDFVTTIRKTEYSVPDAVNSIYSAFEIIGELPKNAKETIEEYVENNAYNGVYSETTTTKTGIITWRK